MVHYYAEAESGWDFSARYGGKALHFVQSDLNAIIYRTEKILEEFSKTLDKVPELEGTYYITDNLNLNREDESVQNDASKIVRNARTDKDGNVVVKKAEWTG